MLYDTKNPHGGDIYTGNVLLDYSANTNPFGTPDCVQKAICRAVPELHRYPDPYCRELCTAISAFEEVPKEYILCGSGAADLIYAYAQAVRPKTAAELAPTFCEYAQGLARANCRMMRYVLSEKKDFELDEGILSFLQEHRPEVLFLCNPNNPTGRLTDPILLKKILQGSANWGMRLFIDECFLDLSDGGISMKPFLTEQPRLFLLKAFTKSYGMAGIRLGYCLCADAELLREISKGEQPWNVSSLAQAAGVAALQAQTFLEKTRALVKRERVWLTEALTDLGFRVIPSNVNYLLFRGPLGLTEALKEKGILIRNCENYPGLCPGWYRIAVRRHEENETLMQAVGEVCSWQKT